MSTVKRKCKVVMLPTDKASSLFSYNDNKHILFYEHGRELTSITTHFHLYVLSKDKPEVGDWFICNNAAQQCVEIRKDNKYPYKIINKFNGEIQYQSKHWRNKIIATTDSSLKIEIFEGPPEFTCEGMRKESLPQPSPEFIEVFVREYNKGNIITEVMVEYDGYECSNGHFMGYQTTCTYPHCNKYNYPLLKVDKNNTITISKVKDSWNREEVKNLCFRAFLDHKLTPDKKWKQEDIDAALELFNKWIEKNL